MNERSLDLAIRRFSAACTAASLGIDGAGRHWIPGHEEIQLVLPSPLRAAICDAFGGELMDEFTAHQRIRLGAELRRLEEAV